MFDKTITLYNHFKKNKTDFWQRTVINGCEYAYSMSKTVNQSGQVVLSEIITIRIPTNADAQDRKYIDCMNFARQDDVSQYWTINPKNNLDFVVCGLCNQEITENYKVTQLSKDFLKTGTLKAFSDNTDKPMLRHYKVVAV